MLKARIERISANKRTFLLFLAASAMSFGLAYSGHYLAYLYTVSRNLNNKDSFITVFVFDVLLTLPLTAICTGVFIGFFEQQKRWWVSGAALVPLLLVLNFMALDMVALCFSIGYFILSF